MTATWQQNPYYLECEELVTETGLHIARIEDFGYACYPMAFNPATRNWERGGAFHDGVEAKLWAERMAGEHPLKRGDECPPFYYKRD